MAGKKKKGTAAPRLSEKEKRESRTQAEIDYGTGVRVDPPQLHEMSPISQAVVREGFTNAMSGWRSREQSMIDRGLKGKLPQGVVERLDDRRVDIPTASRNVANVWNRMMDSDNRPDPAWYFGHNRRITRVADAAGTDADRTISAAATMSPQNGPDNEFRAVSAMTDAITNRRQINVNGRRRTMVSMTPDEVQEATSADNADNVKVAKGFDIEGFRHAGTNRRLGWETLLGRKNGVAEMQTAKVPLYDQAIRYSKPDTPLHAEYEARFGDQLDARRVNRARAADAAAGRTGPETLHGVMDRVDLYGLMGRGSDDDPSDPIHDHKILGTRGIAVPDTWMAALMSGQELEDMPGSPSPAKLAASQTPSTSANIPNTTFMGPTEAERSGGKGLTGNAAWGMAAVEAMQGAAVLAREPGSQTNIPPVMIQEMTWVHGRNEVADSVRKMAATPGVKGRGKMASRIQKLTSGSLTGEKEFRGSRDSASNVSRVETFGSFFRGYDNPLDTDSVTIVPRGSAGSSSTSTSRNSDLEQFHANAAGPAPSEMDKRRAIKAAMEAHNQERAARGVTDSPDPRRNI